VLDDEQPQDEAFDEDLCGYGCHAGGVAPGSVSVGCEHGTFEVSQKHWRTTPPATVVPATVHDQSIHHESEQKLSADSGAVRHLLDTVNGHNERILQLEAQVRQLIAAQAPAEAEADSAE
jgi:hypothetical protein